MAYVMANNFIAIYKCWRISVVGIDYLKDKYIPDTRRAPADFIFACQLVIHWVIVKPEICFLDMNTFLACHNILKRNGNLVGRKTDFPLVTRLWFYYVEPRERRWTGLNSGPDRRQYDFIWGTCQPGYHVIRIYLSTLVSVYQRQRFKL